MTMTMKTTTTLAYFLISFRNDTVCLIKARDRSHLDPLFTVELYVRGIHCVCVRIYINNTFDLKRETRAHRTKTKQKETPSQNSQSVSRSSSICRKLSEGKKMTEKKYRWSWKQQQHTFSQCSIITFGHTSSVNMFQPSPLTMNNAVKEGKGQQQKKKTLWKWPNYVFYTHLVDINRHTRTHI